MLRQIRELEVFVASSRVAVAGHLFALECMDWTSNFGLTQSISWLELVENRSKIRNSRVDALEIVRFVWTRDARSTRS